MARRTTKKTAETKSAADTKTLQRPGPRRRGGGSAAPLGARPVWSGNLRLALVSVPVKAYAATRAGQHVSFHQVHQPSGKRVRYQKIVPGIGPVDTDEIVKGFEVEKGRYVLIDPAEVDAIKLEAKHTLDLVQFVRAAEIDPIWYDRPYYVVPDGEMAEEAYGVLRDAMRAAGRIALGQFVMRGRGYVAAIKPCGSGLLLETLRYADEVQRAAPFFASVGEDGADRELLDLAGDLIERKSAPFDPKLFVDQYETALRELVEARAERTGPVEIGEAEAPGGGAKVIDLVEALKRSVGAAKRPASRRKAG